jgi:NAD(P)-dependent dehydrogenase (short-subunit alcohol dehydrogenase family)
MSTIQAPELLRPGLLEGVSILLAGCPSAGPVQMACVQLGASVSECRLDAESSEGEAAPVESVDGAVAKALARTGAIDMLVLDGSALFAQGGLHACLDAAWDVTRATVNTAFLPARRGGRILYIAPAPGAGERADAARAGLENLARTLSIEWARHAITLVAIAPAASTSAGEVAALAAYLASPAGAYFSGCLLDLRGP